MLKRIIDAASSHPLRIAYRIGKGEITYASLVEKAEKRARVLKSLGITPVMIYDEKSVDTVISILSCIMASRAYIPLDLTSPVARVEQIARLSGAGLVITRENITSIGIPCINPSTLDSYSVDTPAKTAKPGDIAYIIFTSGTTGDPKGVPISYGNLDNFIEWISSIEPLCEYSGATVMNQAQFCFDLSVADLYYSLCNGHTLVSYDGSPTAAFIRNNGVEVMVITPTFARFMLLNSDFSAKLCPSLKCIYFCGETLEKKTVQRLWERFPNLRIINAYGPTEATSAVSATEITRQHLEADKPLPIGDIDTSATEISIEDGEIVLRGKSVFDGYLGSANKTADSNGVNLYRTGDLGYAEDGLLYFIGRRDSQIKYKGYRIETGDIEANIMKLDCVRECAVIPKRDNDTVKAVWAYVSTDGKMNGSDIKEKLKALLPEYMIPKKIILLDSLPVNSNNKIDRKVLQNL